MERLRIKNPHSSLGLGITNLVIFSRNMYTEEKKKTLKTHNTEEKFPTCPPYWLLPVEDDPPPKKNNFIYILKIVIQYEDSSFYIIDTSGQKYKELVSTCPLE